MIQYQSPCPRRDFTKNDFRTGVESHGVLVVAWVRLASNSDYSVHPSGRIHRATEADFQTSGHCLARPPPIQCSNHATITNPIRGRTAIKATRLWI
jgi:hypothetical protein